MDILDEIRRRVQEEKRTPPELYETMRAVIVQMLITQSMSREQVVSFCSSMVSMYNQRDKQK